MDTVKEGIRMNLMELLAMSGKRNIDLAVACGVGKSAVSNWLSGKSSIDIERIPAICDFFGITIDEFFGRALEMQPRDELTAEEESLVELFRAMEESDRSVLMDTAKRFAAFSGAHMQDGEKPADGALI